MILNLDALLLLSFTRLEITIETTTYYNPVNHPAVTTRGCIKLFIAFLDDVADDGYDVRDDELVSRSQQ